MSEHSPGPWRWAERGPACLKTADDKTLILGLNQFTLPTAADARLIAAAPEPLEMLRNFDVPGDKPDPSAPYEERCLLSRGSPLHLRILALLARIDGGGA